MSSDERPLIIVDDIIFVRQTLEQALLGEGYRTATTSDGAMASRICQNSFIAFIVTKL